MHIKFDLICTLCECGAEIGHLKFERDLVYVIMIGSECKLRLVIPSFLA
jgi:hypothetical protein